MTGLLATARLDMRLQARHQLYTIGLIVAVAMGLAGRFLLPAAWMGRAVPAFVLLGIGGTTYMFGASTVLLEKGERTLQALRTAPVTARAYLLSKALTLTAFAAVECAVVCGIAAWGTPFSPLPLALGVAVLGLLYTLVGLGQVAPHTAVTAFLIPDAVVVTMVFQLPFLGVLDVGPAWLWYLIPTQAPLLLTLAAFEPIAAWQWAYALGVSALSIAGAWTFATRRFRAHVGLQEG